MRIRSIKDNPMKVVAVGNEKGGPGKTTMAVNIAGEMARRGKNVLLIDADPQANATTWCRLAEAPALYDLLVRDAAWQEVWRTVSPVMWQGEAKHGGFLSCLPSNMETRTIPMYIQDIYGLDTRLQQLRGVVDLVIIDTPPTPNLFHTSVYLAADGVLLPTELSVMSLRQMKKTIEHVERMKNMRDQQNMGAVEVLGIIPNLYRASTNEQSENLEALKARYGDRVWPKVSLRTVMDECPRAQMTVAIYAPGSEAASEMKAIVDRFEREVFEEIIDESA